MASRIFLKLGDLEGSCGDEQHQNWIELTSFSYGLSNSINCTEKVQGNPGGEACTHANVNVTKQIDKTTPALNAYASVGKMWPEADIEVYEENDILYKIKLENTAISDLSIAGGAGGIPEESMGLGFSKITWQYRDGAEQYWDTVSNKGSLDK